MSFYAFPFGQQGDIPVPGDYDADGKTDAGIFRPSSDLWFVLKSTSGTIIQQFGVGTDTPLPGTTVRGGSETQQVTSSDQVKVAGKRKAAFH